MPLTNDGKIDSSKLQELGFSEKEINTIKENYGNNMSAANKKAIYDTVYKRNKNIGRDVKNSIVTENGRAFML